MELLLVWALRDSAAPKNKICVHNRLIDNFSPYYGTIRQDPLFSGCLSFPIMEGVTIMGSGQEADIRLDGEEILPKHAVIVHQPQRGDLSYVFK